MSNLIYSNQRQAYGEELLALGAKNPNIVVCDADLSKSTMTYPFSQKYPERFFEMGIAEANMTGFAAGLSLAGKIAVTNSFAVFSAGRSYDQIRQGIAIGKLNVKINGSSAGLSDFGDGATHQSVEDIAIMRAIPNMTVLVPADSPQLRRMVHWMMDHAGPVYLRICRNNLPEICPADVDPVRPAVMMEGSDLALVACGVMVYPAMQAARALREEGVSCRVINVPCLKPFPDEEVARLCRGVKGVVTAEEHSIIGGLTSAVAWALRGSGLPLEAVAIMDMFGQSAQNVEELMAHYHLTDRDIVQKAKAVLASRS
ncbi:MAG: transketolase family protein [Christensenellales bacterium]|jgi:transketolase